jgi:hypothetical protein
MLHIDVVDQATLADLIRHRSDMCVSIYLDTTPLTQEAVHDRIKLKNLTREAMEQLSAAEADKRRMALLQEHLDDLVDDDAFWQTQAWSLAVLATPDSVRSYRIATRVKPMVAVSDRFHLGPLFRVASVGQSAYVLALSEGSVRLISVTADAPAVDVRLPTLPKDAASALHRASISDRSPSGRIHGSEGQKVLLRQYALIVEGAVSAFLRGQRTPLILAADTTLASIFRSVASSTHLAAAGIERSPERLSEAELAEAARPILDGLHRAHLAEWTATFAAREPAGRATTDTDHIARAATMGAVDSLMLDIDRSIEGLVDEESGVVSRAAQADATHYDIIDEIAGRVLLAGGTVYGVRADDLPGGKPLAAVLRFPI